ncbi:MAG: hypothetical protein DMG67_06330, partial [Acidobacteria bacterium]
MEDQRVGQDERFVTLLEAALGMPPDQREAFLMSVCGDDLELLGSLQQELRWEERMGNFLLDPLLRRQSIEHPFKPGDLITTRFRIVRELGEGGMGVIYEAVDERLDQRRALKCAKPGFQMRLPPEARAAMRVTHDNVCRVYEFHTAETDHGSVDFLCMEYVEGETLADRIRRQGPFRPSQAEPILRQLCLGLEAAHQDGLLHRDLKSNNVMLAPSRSGNLRAVIMDFGLARDAAPSFEAALRLSSNLRGAPAYIAPELWRGAKATVASDIYSLGVIAYELITGRYPFPAEAPVHARLNQLPPAPSTQASEVDSTWDKVILTCLHPEPAKRFSSAREIIEALQRTDQHKGRILTWIGLAGVALAAVISYLLISGMSRNSEPIRLSVLPMQTNGCDSGAVNGLLYDVSDRLRRLPGLNLVVIPVVYAVQNQVTQPKMAAARLGATHILQTSVQCTGEKIALTANVLDAKTLAEVRKLSGKYTTGTLNTMSTALLGTVTAAFRLPLPEVREEVAPEAYPYYAQGIFLNRRDNHSSDQAIPLFDKALQLDRKSPLPYTGLTEAYVIKYRNTRDPQWLDRAREALAQAESRNPDSAMVHFEAGGLSREAGWYDKAIDSYKRAILLQPSNGQFWHHLGVTYESMHGRQADAVQAFQKAAELQPGYFAPYLDLGIFYFQQGNYSEAEAQFRRVVELAPESEAGNSDLCAIFVVTARYVDAESACRRAMELYPSARAYNNLGASMAFQGKDNDALVQYRRAIALEPQTYES